MVFEKFIVLALTAILLWWAYPHVSAHEWIGPTALPPQWWGLAQAPEYQNWANPSQGYGFYTIDGWNGAGTPRPATKADFSLQPLN